MVLLPDGVLKKCVYERKCDKFRASIITASLKHIPLRETNGHPDD